jgi:hypothetical protein
MFVYVMFIFLFFDSDVVGWLRSAASKKRRRNAPSRRDKERKEDARRCEWLIG